jgi:hypothetical protein
MISIWSRPCLAVVLLCAAITPACAQQAPAPASAAWDEGNLTSFHGTVHPLTRMGRDLGAVGDDLPVPRMLLLMARPPSRESALDEFLRKVHEPGSAVYHQWLTPEEFGARFGATDEDIQIVSKWLASHGLSVTRVTKSRSILEFSGTAGQIREALHTEIHQYSVNGQTFYANASEIAVPAAIASRIAAFAPLNNIPLTSYARVAGRATIDPSNHRVTPQFTLSEDNAPFYALAPEDFATQYDVAPVYAAGMNGAGQTIGIIGESNLNLSLLDAYRTLFNLPADHVQVIIDGQDPGDGGAPNVEGYLDVEVSGAIAPAATVNFYIAGAEAVSDPVWNPVTLAALRAVEDNEASVLSASFGECEQELGEEGNQMWSAIWEQAAAQGQTVFVSSGDGGPSTCLVATGTPQNLQFLPSVNVNGLSSTPWDVSVGGTDFYYSDYASGAPSAATLWNQTNDASNGSLKAPLPEQPWDDSLGFNAIQNPTAGGAGGGGVSSCSQESPPADGSLPACLSGYAKPAWQNAPGVPDDGARDLPDVSLFASNGANLSATPLCAEPGDCAPATGGEPQITLVGGTSVSSPSMAAVMALIDQNYGRQGQADYTLYALARQVPSVFHDITLGTNDVTCISGIGPPDCDVPIPNQPYLDSFGIYAAGPGYDMASGLGSIDVNQLLTNWSKVEYAASTTSLQISPASIVHGTAVTVSVAVKANAGSQTPTGNVVLESGPGTTIPENAPLSLANGAASTSLTNLPGGSYEVTAEYAGDGSFSASSSAPVSLTVTPESSMTALTYFAPVTLNSSVPPKGQVPYGAALTFSATPSGAVSQTAGLATGSVTFTDGATTATLPLDGNGVATWRPQSLAAGAYTITAAYSGDASFTPSTSAPLSITVVKAAPNLEVAPDTPGVVTCGPSGVCSGQVFEQGSNVLFSVLMSGGIGTPPTGTVTVNFGTTSQTATLTTLANIAAAWVTFPSVPAGSYALSATYGGDSNWSSATYTAPTPLAFGAPDQGVTASTTLTLSPSTVDSSGSVTFNVTSTTSNQNGCFIGTALAVLYADGVSFNSVPVSCNLVNGVVTVAGSATIPGSELPWGTYQVVAQYLGTLNQPPSYSSPVPLTVTITDFSLFAMGKNLQVATGRTLAIPVTLGGPSSNTVAVALTCATSSPSIGCTVSPESASVAGSASGTLTINAFTAAPASTAHNSRPSRKGLPTRTGEGLVFALLVFVALPGRKRSRRLWVMVAACVFLSVASGCGSNPTQSHTGPGMVNAPAGSYTVTVTGVSGSITHSTTVYVQVQ